MKELSGALTNKGFRISPWAMGILDRTPLAEAKTEIELVLVTVGDLDFNTLTRRDAVYKRAEEFGLNRVPAEVGPQLRLQLTNQPMNRHVRIAMEPIAVLGIGLRVFNVTRNNGGQWLGTDDSRPSARCDLEHQWVFTASGINFWVHKP